MAVPDASASRQPRAPHDATTAVGLDDDVADVAGVPGRPVEQLAVDDDPTADAGRHGERAERRQALGRAEPTLGQRQGLGVEIAVHRELEHLAQVLAQRERPPGRDVHRRHGRALALDRSGATDADRRDDDAVVLLDLLELLAHDPDERGEVRLRTDVALDRHERAVEQFAPQRHQPGRELRAADVDGEDHVTRWVHGARTISPSPLKVQSELADEDAPYSLVSRWSGVRS